MQSGAKNSWAFDEKTPQIGESNSVGSESPAAILGEMRKLSETLAEIHRAALEEIQVPGNGKLLLERSETAREVKRRLRKAQARWRKVNGSGEKEPSQQSAPWHFPHITLFQLLNEIASQEQLYILPAELAAQKVSLLGEFAIPKDIWPELLDWILLQQGLGQRAINPLCRQIYRLSDEPLSLETFTDKKGDLSALAPHTRLCLLISLDQEAPSFGEAVEKFARSARVAIKTIGAQVGLIGRCSDLQSLLKICHLIASGARDKTYRVVALRGIGVGDLQLAFEGQSGAKATSEGKAQSDLLRELDTAKLRIIPLVQTSSSSLLLIGSHRDVEQACAIIEQIETQIEAKSHHQLFWYLCKNEKPQVLADLARQIAQMLKEQSDGESVKSELSKLPSADAKVGKKTPLNATSSWSARDIGPDTRIAYDAKSGYLVMSLPEQLVPKMQRALARFDLPKKMVRIDFALLEHKITDCNRSGIQLLRLGSLSSNTSAKGLSYSGDEAGSSGGRGILEFALSKASRQRYLPSYDLTYHFLLSQENVKINANPSILTINGVPAQLHLVEETSINRGVGKSEKGGRNLQAIFQRAKYGIKIEITPHIQYCDGRHFIALETDLSFDTRKASSDYRPDVSTRHIKTTVRVADGQSAILGGLKQKDLESNREKIPFLGDLPGIGKLFGTTLLVDKTTEMFLFITPKIVDSNAIDNVSAPPFSRADESAELRAKVELACRHLKDGDTKSK